MKFLNNVLTELKKVVWPNRNITIMYTLIVVVVALFIAYYLGLFDYIFTYYGLGSLLN